MSSSRVDYIKSKYNVLSYAREVLSWPVSRDGDRVKSLAPDSHNKTALIVHESSWHDFKTGDGGDVIDLCAAVYFAGDKGAAIRELSREYSSTDDKTNYSKWLDSIKSLEEKISLWHKNLRQEDIDYLHARRILDSTIERLKIGYDPKEERLIVPYFKNGHIVYYVGRDRHIYYKFIDGQAIPEDREPASKYKKAALTGLNENCPWGLHTLTPKHREKMSRKSQEAREKYNLDLEKILVIAEGVFDVISFEQEGFKCLSPMGGYFSKRVNQYVIDLCRNKSEIDYVFVLFDNDKAGANFQVNMCKSLFANRVNFVCGVLPPDIKDTSEFYAGGGDLCELVKDALPGINELAKRITDKSEFKDFVCEAARFCDSADLLLMFSACSQFPPEWLNAIKNLATKCPAEGVIIKNILQAHTLKFVENVGFYEYMRGVWLPQSDNVISGYFVNELGRFATGAKLKSLLSFLRSQISCEFDFNRQHVFNFRNGILDLSSGELRHHSPEYNSSIQMKYNYNAQAKCLKWEQFIFDIMDGDSQKMSLLQEIAGYILFPDLRMQKCFFLLGEGGNGKSVFINVLREVFGDENCSSVPMSNLGSQFEPIRLLNSLVNFANETETNIKEAEARFKAIVAGDKISACYKGKDFIEFSPRCVMISACNKFINSSDSTRGFLRRIMFVNFTRTFEGSNDNKNLTRELLQELPGIFNWCYKGYKSLMLSQEFTRTSEQAEILQEFTDIIDPVSAFFREELSRKLNKKFTVNQIYMRYCEWCRECGHQAQSRQRFARSIKIIIKRELPDSLFGHSDKETTIILKNTPEP